jgi:four helix bundle protein
VIGPVDEARQDGRDYRLDEFELYKPAREFRERVYHLIKQLPAEERYCLDPQMRKAALSVTNNIAEGHGRWHYQESIRFCRISRGSVEEIIDDVNTCLDEGYGNAAENGQLREEGYSLIGRINSYIAYLRKCKQGATSEGIRR